MIQYVIVNGFPGCGKTTFEAMCEEELGDNGISISSIEIIKAAAKLLGWDGEKTPEARKFLSDLKQLSNATFDTTWNYVKFWVEAREAELNKRDGNGMLIAFVDVREPEEIERYKRELGAITVFIDRTNVSGIVQSNASDGKVRQFDYDYCIENNGTLEDLTNKAKWFIINVLKRGNGREDNYEYDDRWN